MVIAGLRFRGVRIWLEDDIGNRAFESHGPLPVRVREPLHAWVTGHRNAIEAAWIRVMVSKGWLRIRVLGKTVDVVAYPDHETMIERVLDFTSCPVWLDEDDVAMEGDVTLVLGVKNRVRAQVRHRLNRLIWTGADDGSHAGTIPF